MIFLNFLLKKYYVFSFYFYEIQNILRLVIQAFPYFKFLKNNTKIINGIPIE
jgi:hypothetical protein